MANANKLLSGAQQHMEPGERILASVAGSYQTTIMGSDTVRSGILIATDRRVVFFAKKLTGYELESYPYASVSSIDQGKNIMGHRVTFYTSGNRVDVKWIRDISALNQFVNIAKSHIHARTTVPMPHQVPTAPSSVALPPPNSRSDNVFAQIQILAELHRSGVLTDAEFTSKKEELLRRL